MSLHLIESAHQEQLAATLVAKMAASVGKADQLKATSVIVQNAGLGRWLRLYHANRCGISAAVKMPFAQSYIVKELQQQGFYDPWQELSPAVLRWQIFDLLQSRVFEQWEECAPLTAYLSVTHGNLERRCWSLAGRLADLFDRYSVHRPEWIEAWAKGASFQSPLAHWQWQAQLFKAVIEQRELQPEDLERCLLGRALQNYLEKGGGVADADSSALHVFGISSFPPVYLRFFQSLARMREVYLYHLIPSEAYLGDLPKNYRESLLTELNTGDVGVDCADLLQNSLLIANGQSAARFQSLLLSLDFPAGEIPQVVEDAPSRDLQRLQEAVRLNEPVCDFEADGSLSIHQCHSRIREVQVLQQQLLALFAADSKLRPKDIMVLVPEIGEYTNAIQSVFEMGTRRETDLVKIPYCIADQKSSGDANCWRFFNALLSVLKGRQLFSEVMALLDFDPICQRLGLDREMLKELSSLLQSVGVRWGIDGATRKAKGLPGYEPYSWDYGFQQVYDGLIYGEWTPTDRASQVTSSQLLEALGSLTQLLRPIFDLAVRSQERHSFKEWSESLLAVLRQSLGDEHQSGEWMRLLAVAIGELQQHATDTEIGFDTYCKMLEEGEHSDSGPSGMLRRGVTFCRLQPARHIPAKVVCILGLNEGSYPRQEKSLEFDLIDLHRRSAKTLKGTDLRYQEIHYLGDGHLRDEDRQLFLDCLLNARDRLYLSYVGQSDQSNEDLPPSLLVSELKQFLERVPDCSLDALSERKELLKRVIVRHPLQDWSLENFKQALPKDGAPPVPVQFNAHYATIQPQSEAKLSFLGSSEAEPVAHEQPALLSADQILRFLKDPAASYLKQQLYVNLDQLKWLDVHADQEAFDFDALDGWSLRQAVFDEWFEAKQKGTLSDDFASDLKRQWELDLTLPLGHAGDAVWNRQVAPVLVLLNSHLSEVELRKSDMSIEVGGITYRQAYWQTAEGARLIFIGGDLKSTKYLLQAFIEHIGAKQGSLILSLKDQTCISWPAFPIHEGGQLEVGLSWLAEVLPLWSAGLQSPLPFSLEIGRVYVDALISEAEADPEELLTRAYHSKWTVYGGYGQDCSDAQCLCFDNDSPSAPHTADAIRDAFAAHAECILRPVLEWYDLMNPKKGAK